MPFRQASVEDGRTVVAQEVLARLGDRWSVRALRMIEGEPIRFTNLKRKISVVTPISARVLTRTLKQLERDGLIARRVFPVIPPRVEYRLTGLGRRFLDLAGRIAEWTMMYSPDIQTAHQAAEHMTASGPQLHQRAAGTATGVSQDDIGSGGAPAQQIAEDLEALLQFGARRCGPAEADANGVT